MSFILTSPPALEPVALAEAKAHLRVTHTDEDALISGLIVSARWQVEAATSLRLISQGWSIFADRWPKDGVLHLPLAPLIAVNDVTVFGEDDTPSVIDPAHYIVDPASRPPRLILRPDRVWARPGRIADGIEIAVTAGFGTAPGDVPAPLRQAMLRLIAHAYENRGNDEAVRQPPPGFAALVAPFREARL